MPFFSFCSRKRWRTWLAAYLFIAVAWPATGPLPWLMLEPAEHVAAKPGAHHGDRTAAVAGDAAHDDASTEARDVTGIPGSPTHPLDHDCAQCEVLKHLARCVLPDACQPGVAPAPAEAAVLFVVPESRHASFIATRPPIRGPPSLAV